MATYLRWRGHAKDLLYNYQENKRLLAEAERDIIHGQAGSRDNRYRRGGVANSTQARAIRLASSGRVAELHREVAAVDALLRQLQAPGSKESISRMELLRLVYFKASHTLQGAAAYIGVSERTARRWNTEMLAYVAERMGWV